MSLVTNEANGNFVRFEHSGVGHDIEGTRVAGSIFIFTTIEAGQPGRCCWPSSRGSAGA
jgi:hypothetical protein